MQRKKFDNVFRSLADLFKILAHPDRLRILSLISDEEIDVGHICAAIGISQSSASQHLKLLRLNHLVVERREGKRVFYKLDSPLVENLILSAVEIHSQELSRESKTVDLYKEIKSLLKSKYK